jgi:aminoglycoside phosphotransferase (APT) family kinase protein
MKITENQPGSQVLQWVKGAVAPNAVVRSVSPLNGATSSSLFNIEIEQNKTISNFVLRQFDNKDWLKEEPDLALHEAESLKRASEIKLATPELIAFDEKGTDSGKPSLLMTKLPGAVELKPEKFSEWLFKLAETLHVIHKVEVDPFSWHYFSYNDPEKLETPKWSTVINSWKKAIQIAKGPRLDVQQCFHRDFHPANVFYGKMDR